MKVNRILKETIFARRPYNMNMNIGDDRYDEFDNKVSKYNKFKFLKDLSTSQSDKKISSIWFNDNFCIFSDSMKIF